MFMDTGQYNIYRCRMVRKLSWSLGEKRYLTTRQLWCLPALQGMSSWHCLDKTIIM